MSETDDLPSAAMRVRDAAVALALPIVIESMAAATRTAEEAAAACGCAVAQIIKSLVFTGVTSGTDYLLLVSGANRVDETGVAEVIGEALVRPRANHVRDVTGYAIGGIPPFGHRSPLKTYIDKDLLAFETVWAAAGTPNTVFSCDPNQLRDAIGATTITVS